MSAVQHVTILDVARQAGVGVGTVSRVLNHGRSVRPATAKLVRTAMAGLGYQPPPPEKRRGPRLGGSNPKVTDKAVLVALGRYGLRWMLDCAPVYSYVLHGIELALAERGRNLLVRQVRDWAGLEQSARQTDPEGLILFGEEPAGTASDFFRQQSIVWVMGSPRQLPIDHVQPDHAECGALAARWAVAQGNRCCALIGQGWGAPDHQGWYRNDAFRWVLEQADGVAVPLMDAKVIVASAQQNIANEAVLAGLLDKLVAMSARPTALFSQADLLTPTIYRLLAERGITPQRDIAVITVNNERPYLTALSPQPIIIDLQAETIGRRAVDQLFWRLQHRAEPRMRILIDPLLVEPTLEGSRT